MDDSKRLLTTREAAEYAFGSDANADYQRFMRLIRQGQVPVLRSGKKMFVPRAALETALGIDGVPGGREAMRPGAGSLSDQANDSG